MLIAPCIILELNQRKAMIKYLFIGFIHIITCMRVAKTAPLSFLEFFI